MSFFGLFSSLLCRKNEAEQRKKEGGCSCTTSPLEPWLFIQMLSTVLNHLAFSRSVVYSGCAFFFYWYCCIFIHLLLPLFLLTKKVFFFFHYFQGRHYLLAGLASPSSIFSLVFVNLLPAFRQREKVRCKKTNEIDSQQLKALRWVDV